MWPDMLPGGSRLLDFAIHSRLDQVPTRLVVSPVRLHLFKRVPPPANDQRVKLGTGAPTEIFLFGKGARTICEFRSLGRPREVGGTKVS